MTFRVSETVRSTASSGSSAGSNATRSMMAGSLPKMCIASQSSPDFHTGLHSPNLHLSFQTAYPQVRIVTPSRHALI
jgi:hypothetical protein